ncbi:MULTISPECIES: biotin--[acetyl-CoA-carboxylase] ligase [unclassified Flavobacterium]|uniref:biotin--[acetyl-CoA-carboxylase] ligase n=1 Tax=unclassified Flavobacterium TaxID=196869 RepID=UPI001F133377|nr:MULTISPECIES: biotin--[acetyl-CoA-carboxylase] ligase [unclassified Flavobacterium]UMY64875.1 biotin--[acetyl-CoA-carboxylase] ligase [Flavobacterium sp. HJ-32-4]
MFLIKLDATPSTNDYLRELSGRESLPDYTVVTADYQSAGRGQMGAKWESGKGQNLMFSVLVRNAVMEAEALFRLNAAIALAVALVLERLGVPDTAIKWPNDILSGNRKLAGILIENTFGSQGITSVIGIGVNVNQTQFDGLPYASSMCLAAGIPFDRDSVLNELVAELKTQVAKLSADGDGVWASYHAHLFRKDRPSAFEDEKGQRFMGIIRHVDASGKLVVELEDETRKSFAIKELKLLY